MFSGICRRRTWLTSLAGVPLLLAGCTITPVAAQAQGSPSGPLAPPVATQVLTRLEAAGTQRYVCRATANGRPSWVYVGPSAQLYDAAGQPLATLGTGPAWEGADGSRITGRLLQTMPNPDAPASLPLELLQASNAGLPGWLESVRYVQRLATHGGLPPARPCSADGQQGRSPFMAEYVFLE
jgi:hypothetical protein